MNDKYVAPSVIKKQFNVTGTTLIRWANEGKIRFLRPNGTRRIYNLEDVNKFFGVHEPIKNKKTIIYARVSSAHQKEDLERQISYLKEQYPQAEVIKDIGSGLNWNRPGIKALLEEVHKGNVGKIVVTYKDRLCRFGGDLMDWIFQKADVKLLVLNQDYKETDPTIELADDLLAITTVFVARNNGLRAGRYRKERARKKKEIAGKEDQKIGERDTGRENPKIEEGSNKGNV